MKKFAPKPAPRGARPTTARPAGARATSARAPTSRAPTSRAPTSRAAPARPAGTRPARTTRDAPPRKSYGRDDERAPRKSFSRDDAPPPRAPRKSFSRDDAPPPRAPRKPFSRDDAPPARARTPRPRDESFGDPYQRAARPPRSFTPRDAGARPERSEQRGERGERFSRGSGFTVTLDPDVARVFRGDASVNKALRLVMQLVQVVEGPGPRREGDTPRRGPGYQGSPEARGFERKPRFVEDEDSDDASPPDGSEDIEGEE